MNFHPSKTNCLTLSLALALALIAAPSRAITEDGTPQMPAGGWGNSAGAFQTGGGFSGCGGDTVCIRASRLYDDLSPIYVITVVAAQPVPHETDVPNPIDPAKQKACIDICDQKQKIALDMCAVAAAKASASANVTAVGIGLATGGAVSIIGDLKLGAVTGLGAYFIANQMAKDHAATLNLACTAAAAQNHTQCVTGKCKFSG